MGIRRSVALLRRKVSSVSHVPSDEVVPGNPLVDRFGRVHDYLRISLTERCNLRCEWRD